MSNQTLINDLVEAYEAETTPQPLKMLLAETVMHLLGEPRCEAASAEIIDNCRMNTLEDLGHFTLTKPDGEDYLITAEVFPGHFLTARAATLRETIDLMREELNEIWRSEAEPEPDNALAFCGEVKKAPKKVRKQLNRLLDVITGDLEGHQKKGI